MINSGTAFTSITGELDPEVIDAYEVGAKVGIFDGRLALTASAFQMTKNNATIADPGGSGFLIAYEMSRGRRGES